MGLSPYYLAGGIPTPLKNDGVRQLGWWHSQYDGKNNPNVPNHQPVIRRHSYPMLHPLKPWQNIAQLTVALSRLAQKLARAQPFFAPWTALMKQVGGWAVPTNIMVYMYIWYIWCICIYIGIYIYIVKVSWDYYSYIPYIYIEGIIIGIVTWNIYHIYHYNEIQPTDEFPCDFGWENDAFNGANGWSNHSLVSFKDYPLINIQIAIENGHRNSEFSH